MLKHYEFAPWLSYSLNVNPDGRCGSDVVWIDQVTVTRIGLDDPPPLEPTPTPQPIVVILEDDFTNPAGPMPKPDEASAPIPTDGGGPTPILKRPTISSMATRICLYQGLTI